MPREALENSRDDLGFPGYAKAFQEAANGKQEFVSRIAVHRGVEIAGEIKGGHVGF